MSTKNSLQFVLMSLSKVWDIKDHWVIRIPFSKRHVLFLVKAEKRQGQPLTNEEVNEEWRLAVYRPLDTRTQP